MNLRCAENDCDDNNPAVPDPVFGDCEILCGCLDPAATSYNPVANCSSACVYEDGCGGGSFGTNELGLPMEFGFTGPFDDVEHFARLADPYDLLDGGNYQGPTNWAYITGDADQLLIMNGPFGHDSEHSFRFTMPIDGTSSFSWNFLHDDDEQRPLAWIETSRKTVVLDLRNDGVFADEATELPEDWFGPLTASNPRVIGHHLDGFSNLFDPADWCGLDWDTPFEDIGSEMVDAVPSPMTLRYEHWFTELENGEPLPWVDGSPLGEYAALL